MVSGAGPSQLGVGLGFTEGPAALGDGRVLFTSMTGTIYSVDGDAISEVARTGNGATGLAIDAEGEIYVAASSGLWGAPADAPGGIHRLHDDHAHDVVTEGLEAPNDLAFGPDGWLYITDPMREEGLEEPIPGRVFAYDVAADRLELLHEGGLFPNGIAFDHTGDYLYVAETYSGRIVRYPLVAATDDGNSPRLGEAEVHCETRDGTPDGMAVDAEGNIWQAVNKSDSIQVFDLDGELIELVSMGEGSYPSNCCFGGSRRSTLYVTTAGIGGIATVEAGVEGLALFPFRKD